MQTLTHKKKRCRYIHKNSAKTTAVMYCMLETVDNYYTTIGKNDLLASDLSNINKIRITLIIGILHIRYKVVTYFTAAQYQ